MKTVLALLFTLPLLVFANFPDLAVEPVELDLNKGKHGRIIKRWGKTLRHGRRWHRMLNVVPPKTSRPLYIFIEARENGCKNVEIEIRQGKQLVRSINEPGKGYWQWLRIGPLDVKKLMPDFDICVGRDPKHQFYISRALITTDGKFDPKIKLQTQNKAALTIGKGGSGVTAGPFVLIREKSFSREKSWIKLHRDNRNLYAEFTNFESCLDPKANRLHEFRTNRKNPWSNDHSVLLLKRNGIMYDFIISGSGKIDDARMSGPDFWSSRDPAWDSGAVGRCERGNGVWKAFLQIPWDAIGGHPGEHEEIAFQAARKSNSASEISTLFPTVNGFHDDRDFGVMRFSAEVPEVKFSLPDFIPGRNRFNADGCDVETSVSFQGKAASFSRGTEFDLKHTGTFAFQWSFLDKNSRNVWWRSPEYELSLNAELLTFSGAKTILLNGKNAVSGSLLFNTLNYLKLPDDFSGELRASGRDIVPPDKEFILAAGCSYMWPNWHAGELSIPAGGVQMLLFAPRGFPGKTVRDYTLKLDLPPGFKVECVSGYYKNYELDFTPDGKITFRTPIKYNGTLPGHKYISVFIRAPKKCFTGEIAYSASSRQSKIVEIPRGFKVNVIPEVSGKRPQKYRILLWVEWTRRLTDQNYLNTLAAEFAKYGINEVHELHNTHIPFSYRFNLKQWSWSLEPYVRMHPEAALTGINGKRNNILVCPQYIRTPEFAGWLEQQIPVWLKRAGNPRIIGWDFEHNYKNTPFSCYCSKCIKESDIGSRNKMVAFYAKLIHDALKRYDKKIMFTVYSGYQSPSTRENYCIDWSLFPGIIDMAECGYGRPEKELEATLKAIGKTPLVTGAIIRPYQMENRAYPRQFTPAWLLRRAADGTGGILLFEYSTLNGESFRAVADVSKVIAMYEDFFLYGNRKSVQIPGWQKDFVQAIEYRNKTVLLLMNQGKSDLVYRHQIVKPGGILVIPEYK